MSTPSGTKTLGERIRRVRGEQSQEAFAKRVGLTRSALANYETGRTRPKPSVVRRISEASGLPLSALTGGEVRDFSELAGALGIHDEVGTLPGLTKDEKAIVRVLRLCPASTALSVVSSLVTALEEQSFSKELADLGTIVDDIARLYQIVASDGFYERGVTPDALRAIVDMLSGKAPKE